MESVTRANNAYDGIVFDMDGILIDSEPLFRMAAQRAAQDMGRILNDETFAEWMGLAPPAVETAVRKFMGEAFDFEEFRDRFRAVWIDHTERHGVPAQPGMAELLTQLTARNIPFGVATSTQRDQALRSLELAGLATHITTLVGGDEVERGKPEPEIFERAASALGLEPRRCVAIEDSAVGVRSAASARMMTIMVPDLHPPSAEIARLAHYVLPSTACAAKVILTLFDAQ